MMLDQRDLEQNNNSHMFVFSEDRKSEVRLDSFNALSKSPLMNGPILVSDMDVFLKFNVAQ